MYLALEWEGGRWQLKEGPYLIENREECEEWAARNAPGLPAPRRWPRDTVSFNFSTARMRGEVRSVEWGIYTDRPIRPGEISYTIYASGHARWVRERNLIID